MSFFRPVFAWAALSAAVSLSAQAPAVQTATSAGVSAAAEFENGYLKVGFDQLASYPFTPPPYDPTAAADTKLATGEEQIPAMIRALNGKKTVITGYMVPVKMDKGLVTEFLLMRNTMACCFGGVPNMNEWVVVKMQPGVQPLMDTPISFYGELKVGAVFENGYLTGLYQLKGEKMGETK
jgi:hypothetical protein